jgi:hypothetical protein
LREPRGDFAAISKRRGRQGQPRTRRCLLCGTWAIAEARMTRKAPHPNANLIVVTPFAGSEYQGGVGVCRWRARESLRFGRVQRCREAIGTRRRRAAALVRERHMIGRSVATCGTSQRRAIRPCRARSAPARPALCPQALRRAVSVAPSRIAPTRRR